MLRRQSRNERWAEADADPSRGADTGFNSSYCHKDAAATNLGQSVGLLEGEDGGDRADDHDEDGGEEHGVQHAVLGGDAWHPPVADLKRDICRYSLLSGPKY